MIVRTQNTSKSYKLYYIYNWKFLLQHPKDQSVDHRNHLPGQYLDIALVPGQYLDIALVTGKYKKYCPASVFDLSMQSGTYSLYSYTKH